MTSYSGLATLQEGYYDVMLRASDTGRGIMTSCSGLATLGGRRGIIYISSCMLVLTFQ